MADPTPLSDVDRHLSDPLKFAEHLFDVLSADGLPEPLAGRTTAIYQEMKAATRALEERYPHEAGVDGSVRVADEAAHAWALECHAAGIAFGVAAEKLRRTLLAGGD